MIRKIMNRVKKRRLLKDVSFVDEKKVFITGKVDFGTEPYLIHLGKNVTLADGVKFLTHDGGVRVIRQLLNKPEIDLIRPIIIKDNVFIGANCTILYGVTIETNVIVGCGSIVTKNLSANGVYAGVPAKYICSIEEFLAKHESEFLPTKELSSKEKRKFLKTYFEQFVLE